MNSENSGDKEPRKTTPGEVLSPLPHHGPDAGQQTTPGQQFSGVPQSPPYEGDALKNAAPEKTVEPKPNKSKVRVTIAPGAGSSQDVHLT